MIPGKSITKSGDKSSIAPFFRTHSIALNSSFFNTRWMMLQYLELAYSLKS